MDNQFIIFISCLIIFNIIIFASIENFPYGNYVRSTTFGRLIPRARDRDTSPMYHINKTDEDIQDDKDEENKVYVQHIETDLPTGNYMWNGNLTFPYGTYIYDRTYPVYPAPNICPSDKPYYNTLDGTCIFVSPKTPTVGSDDSYGTVNNLTT